MQTSDTLLLSKIMGESSPYIEVDTSKPRAHKYYEPQTIDATKPLNNELREELRRQAMKNFKEGNFQQGLTFVEVNKASINSQNATNQSSL